MTDLATFLGYRLVATTTFNGIYVRNDYVPLLDAAGLLPLFDEVNPPLSLLSLLSLLSQFRPKPHFLTSILSHTATLTPTPSAQRHPSWISSTRRPCALTCFKLMTVKLNMRVRHYYCYYAAAVTTALR